LRYHRGVDRSALVLAFALAACGGKAAPADAGLPSATGVLIRSADGSLDLVDGDAHVPNGAQKVGGATIQVLGLDGTLLATVAGGAGGDFTVPALGRDEVALDFYLTGVTTQPDFSRAVTLVDGVTLALGAPVAVDRAKAIAAVAGAAPASALISGTLNPLPAGAQVASSGGAADAAAYIVGAAGEYLFLVDPTPEAAWAHPVEYDLVDAASGAVTRVGASWLPAVNGRLFFDRFGQLVAEGRVSSEVVAIPSPTDLDAGVTAAAAAAPQAAPPGDDVPPADRFAFVLIGADEDWFTEDEKRINAWLTQNGFPADNIVVSDPGSRKKQIAASQPSLDQAQAVQAIFQDLATRIQARIAAGGCPLLFIHVESHGSPAGEIALYPTLNEELAARAIDVSSAYLYPIDALLPLDLVHPAVLRVLVAACFAKSHLTRLQAIIGNLADEDVAIYTTSGTDQSLGHYALLDAYKDVQRGNPLSRLAHVPGLVETYLGATGDQPQGLYNVMRWTQQASMDAKGAITFNGALSFNQGDVGPQLYQQSTRVAPRIASFQPTSGAPGTVVTLTGENLGGMGAKVDFDGVAATVQSGSEISLVVIAPSPAMGLISVHAHCATATTTTAFAPGAPDGGTCAANGGACSFDADCCRPSTCGYGPQQPKPATCCGGLPIADPPLGPPSCHTNADCCPDGEALSGGGIRTHDIPCTGGQCCHPDLGAFCLRGSDCCGYADPGTTWGPVSCDLGNTCCALAGSGCTSAADCCNHAGGGQPYDCQRGTCCSLKGAVCGKPADCCSGSCVASFCQ
jgi:hypothetical protein